MLPKGVGDDGRLVKPGAVGGRSRVARRVRHRNGAPGKVGVRRDRVAPAVRAGVDDAGFRVGAGMRGRDARMVRLRDDKTVDDRSGGRDVGGGDAAFLRPDGARTVFAPLFGSVSPGIDGNDFAFQRGREGGSQRFLRFVIGRSPAVVPGRRDDAVYFILGLFHAVAPRGDARVGHRGRIGEFPGFFRLLPKASYSHRVGAIVVAALPCVRLRFGELPPGRCRCSSCK